jgi:hypothetical protein
MNEKCRCFKDGECHKWHKPTKCEFLDISHFTDKFDTCEMNDVCRRASIFGNAFYTLTDEDIEKLKSGKVLFDIDEYGTFIAYKKGDTENG